MKYEIQADTLEQLKQQVAELEQKVTVEIQLLPITGGTFMMGSPDSDSSAFSDEKPQHKVEVQGFLLADTPITRRQYAHYMDECPKQWDGEHDDRPATHISWMDCIELCNAASVMDDLTPVYTIEGTIVSMKPDADGYRLPTEEEWEYACRAGTTGSRFCEEDELSEYAVYDAEEIAPVRSKKPNPWGLYDMLGNVWEWTYSTYKPYGVS